MQNLPIIDQSELVIKPLAEAETIPSSWYNSDDLWRLEKEAVFAQTWQCVGRQSQAARSGEYFIAEIASEPLIIVRGKDNILRCFYNVCRHRGGPLAIGSGCASHLQCKYHGWTYELDGRLKGVPDFDSVAHFDKTAFGLAPVELAVWEGFVFARLVPGKPSFNELFTGISDRIGKPGLGELQYHRRKSYDLKCNWKIYVDNYLEGYHVPLVHPELMKLYDYHSYKTKVREWYSFQHSLLTSAENIYSSGAGEALYYFIFPNLMLNILPGRLQTNIVEPIDAERCIVHFDYYYVAGTSEQQIADDLTFSDSVQVEDIEICELVHRGVRSRSYDKGRFSVKHEEALWHFQSLLKTFFRDAVESKRTPR